MTRERAIAVVEFRDGGWVATRLVRGALADTILEMVDMMAPEEPEEPEPDPSAYVPPRNGKSVWWRPW